MGEYEIAKDIANIELRLARVESIIQQMIEPPKEETKKDKE